MAVNVIIMRGIPGSGKSTWAKTHHPGAVFCSADDYFTGPSDGMYRFDPTLLSEAHDQCLIKYLKALEFAHECRPGPNNDIVVDNTNIRVFELAPYYRLAEAFKCSVKIVQMYCEPSLAYTRCQHGVPLGVIEGMARSFEPVPTWWNVHYIN